MQRGKKQSLFIGRRVPEVAEDGTPILYRRYTKVEDILVTGEEAAGAGEVPGERGAVAASTSATDGLSHQKAKKQKRRREEANGDAEGEAAGMAAADAPAVAADAPEPAVKKPKKEKKAKKVKMQEQQQDGDAAPAAATAAAAEADDHAQQQQEQEQQAAAAGNADEASKIRSVLGFNAASSNAAPSFGFGFSVEAQVAAETEQKLARIRMADSADSEGYIPRRVFVGGMPYSCDEAAIREYWGWCGEIESLDMLTFPDTGRFRGIAFITFATEEGYKKALEYDGEQVDGQTLRVDRCKAAAKKGRNGAPLTPNGTSNIAAASPAANGGPAPQSRGAAPKTPGYNVAYVGNIAFEVTPEELQALFKEAKRVRLHTDKETGKPKGFAHMHFDSEEALDRALALDGTDLQGRKIKIGYAQPKK